MRKDGRRATGDKQPKAGLAWLVPSQAEVTPPHKYKKDELARGLNVDDVINHDYPNNSEDYIHRIGKIFA
jgi:hypothetical protein